LIGKDVKRGIMKKYLLIVEDERLWEKFKDSLNNDINSEIMELIKRKVNGDWKEGKNGK